MLNNSSMVLTTTVAICLLAVTTRTEAFAPSVPLPSVLPTAVTTTSRPETEWANLLSTFKDSSTKRSTTRTTVVRKKRKMQKAENLQSVLSTSSFRKKGQAIVPSTLLTSEEEIEYAYRIRAYKAALKLRDGLVQHVDGIYVHPTDDVWAAACGTTISKLQQVTEEGRQARAALVSANTGLVVQQANLYHFSLKRITEAGGGLGTILSVADMIQEGHLGLMEAAERFDPEKGFRFSTYATYWVRQRILKSISDTSRVIRLPVYVHDMLFRVRKAKSILTTALGKEPSMKELARYLGITEERLTQYTVSSRNVMSLERPLGGTYNNSAKNDQDQKLTLMDTLVSDGPTPEESMAHASMIHDVQSVLESELDQAERNVLMHRFGFYDNEPKSVSETAVLLNISRDRARLLEARALNKLRHPKNHQKLREYAPKDVSTTTYGRATPEFPRPFQAHQQQFNIYNDGTVTTGTTPRTDRLWFF